MQCNYKNPPKYFFLTFLLKPTTSLPLVLTLWHHVNDDSLAGVGFKLVVGVPQHPVEYALVDSCVIEGHIEDVDGAVL